MIEHTVTFSLKHSVGSSEELEFLQEAKKLSAIPGVRDFMIHRQTNPKNPHTYRISMKFSSREEYDAYSNHPQHNEFVEKRWLTEVTDFMEADFEEM